MMLIFPCNSKLCAVSSEKRMERWIILCDITVCDGDVSCFPVLPIAEATPEHAMLVTWVILKDDSS